MVLYPPPTRPWLYCRVCGVRLTREPIDVPFPGHESWCSQEKWRRIVYKACCRPLHRWLQRWRRLVFKAAQSPFPSMVFSAVASQAPSGDSWPRRMSDESSSSLRDPLGIARFKKPRRRETKETKNHSEEPSGSCAGAPSAPYLSPARPSSLPPRSGGRARPAKLQRVPRQDLEQFARRLQGWTEKHPPFRKGWTDPRGNHICGSGHIHSPENLARAWHDGHAVPRA